MKTKTKKTFRTALLLLAAGCASAALFTLGGSKQATADGCEVTTAEAIKTVYDIQDTFTLPSAQLEYKGQKYDAEKKSILFPDGKEYAADSVVLTVAGIYTLQYACEIEGVILTGSKTFSVYENLYSVSGEGAEVVYQDALNIAQFTGENAKSGLAVTLPMGGTFTYNKVIDLSGKTREDQLLEIFAMPSQIGTPEAGNFVVQFTDAYDPSNYFLVTTMDNVDKPNKALCDSVYQTANAYNQAPTGVGINPNGTGIAEYNGVNYDVHRNSSYGFYGKFSFSAYTPNVGSTDNPKYHHYPWALSMDYENRVLYGCGNAVPYGDGMIADLDAPEFYTNVWEGFTTGEAIMSIYSTNLTADAFHFAITNVCGENLQGGDVVDTKAPRIEIDYEGNDENEIPYAIVNKPYKLFAATAADDYSPDVKCVTAVYYNYRTTQPINVNVTDGCFTPTKQGVYTIVYGAVDGSGNRTIKEIDVEVKAESALEVAFNLLTSDAKIGETFAMRPTVSGNSGQYSVSVKAVLQADDKVAYDLTQTGDVYSFLPLYAGKYDLIVSVQDRSATVEETQETEISVSNSYYQVAEPSLPYVFIKNAKYTLDGMQAYDLSSATPKVTDAKVEYALDGGEYTAYEGGELAITASAKVAVKYSFGSDYSKIYEIPVTDVNYTGGKLRVYNYFYGADYVAEAFTDGTLYATGKDGAKLSFANELLAENFTMEFSVVSKRFAALTMTLTDVENAEEALSLSFAVVNRKTQVTINGKHTTALPFDLATAKVTVAYNGRDNQLTVNDTACALGDFAGFGSHMARLQFRLDGVEGHSSFKVYKLNNQPISVDGIDRVGAALFYEANKESLVKGEDFILKNIIVADVLRRETTFDFSMSAPDESVCTAKDGTKLELVSDRDKEYVVTLTQYGDYLLSGKYSDGANIKRFGITITVVDDGAPVLTITDKVTTAKVHKEITFDGYEVVDNLDTEVDVKVYVMDTYGRMLLLENGKYTPDAIGEYVVIFVAADKNNNVTTVSYTFNVR